MSLRIGVLAVLLSMICAPVFGRSWSDVQGRKVEAEFVRIFNGNVVLKSRGRIVNVPFYQLSDADQEFLRQKLEASGQGNLIPKAPIQDQSGLNNPAGGAPQPNAGPAGAMPQPNAGHAAPPGAYIPPAGTMPPGSMPPGSMPPGYMPPGAMPAGANPAGTMPPGSMPPGMMPNPQAGHAGAAMPPPGASPANMGHSNVSAPQMSMAPPANQTQSRSPFSAPRNPAMPNMASPANNPAFAPNMQPTMQMVYSCSKCKRELPSTIHAGDNCPHCGTYLEYEETAGGGRKYAKWGYRGGVGAIIAIIIGLVQWARNRNA